jgi:cellulose synthase/poly-beta-1,6-N-acetylglucosamine synthase-like glycosyltransferase
MMDWNLLIFWIGIVWLGYTYAGYPLLLGLITLMSRSRPLARNDYLPTVSVLVAARNEQSDIGWKIAETLRWDYPSDSLEVLVASDASDDRTDEIVRGIRDARLHFVRMEERSGKSRALNRLVQEAKGALLFFTDANTHIEPAALRRMVSYFADPSVGCVTGVEATPPKSQQDAMSSGGCAYLGYESWVNQLESKLGSVLVCDGSMFCMRKTLFAPLQPDIANDLESPLRVGGAHYAILFDPTLRSMERATPSWRQEFLRRHRICAQGLLGMWRLRHELRGLRGWQFVSRKFLRWMGLIPFLLILVSSLGLAGAPLFACLAAVQCAFLVLALAGFITAIRGGNSAPVLSIPFYFILVNVAALCGLIDTLRGRRFGIWEQASLSRGAPVSAIGPQ